MARKKTPTLTDGELRIMKIVWELGEATVNDIIEKLPEDSNLAYNTVLTMMRIMETKEYLKHEKKGRAHVYSPLISKTEARLQVINHMVDSFFNGSPELLVQSLIDDDKLEVSDIEKLKRMIREYSRE